MKKRPRNNALKRKLVSLAVASCFAGGLAHANPSAHTVVHGTATFQQAGNLLNITNSPNAIINWGSFSIAAHEVTRFIQQSAASTVLNRVIGQDPSSILGALQSNGRVFLINPNGILFGAGAQIDVAGLVASTLNLSNADFLAGRLNFTEIPGAGSIVNQGNITTAQGGSVYLVAPDITNSGIITSPQGEVILAAGKRVELVNPGTPNLRVEIEAPANEARNLGQIAADSGRIGIYAGLINHSGTIRADSAQVTADGRIVLRATQNATLEAGSVTSANGPSGGTIEIQSGDTTLVSGNVEARGAAGAGGTIHVLGNLVGLTGEARLDASGETGGGTVLVGGDFQGNNPAIQNAFRTYMGPDTSILADAITNGDGGKVIVWSDDATRAYGTISARGGAQGGDGGFVEVSGKRWLGFGASVDTRAPKGKTGSLLLDPNNVEIIAGPNAFDGGLFDGDNPNVFSNGTDGNSQISWSTIQTNLASADVYITTIGDSFFGVADITVVADSPDLATSNTLRLLSHRHITVNGAITNTGAGAIEMYAGWDPSSGVDTPFVSFNGGEIQLNASVTAAGTVRLNAGTAISLAALVTAAEVHLRARNGITQTSNGVITANMLLADGGEGAVNLGNALNKVNVLAGVTVDSLDVGGTFEFHNDDQLTIGTVDGVQGITAIVISGLAPAKVNITTNGNLTVSENISAVSSSFLGNDAEITLTAQNGSINVGAGVALTATGGSESGPPPGSANVTMTSTDGITLQGIVDATGGTQFSAGAAGDANVLLLSGGTINLTGSGITATGGTGPTPGTGTVTVEVSTASGNPTPGGNIIAHNITADDVNLQQLSTTGSSNSILRASGTSLIQADQLLLEVDHQGLTSGGSIGTLSAPIRIQANRLEAHTHEASPGIFIESPNAGALQIGGVTFFGGSVKGVQNVTSGDIMLRVNGTLTTQGGTPGCGSTDGGPICTGGSTITLNANDMILDNVVNATTSGTVVLAPYSTSHDITIGGLGGLSLDAAELQQVTAGTLQIGRSTDTGTLTVETAISTSGAQLSLAHQNIVIDADITASGNVALNAGGGSITQGAGSVIAANALTASATTGIGLPDINQVSSFSASTTGGGITFHNGTALSLGNVTTAGGPVNITGTGDLEIQGNITTVGGAVNITVTTGDLDIPGQINAGTGGISLTAAGGTVYGTGASPDITGGMLSILAAQDIDGDGGLHVQVPQIPSLVATNGNIRITSFSDVTFGDVQAGGDVMLTSTGALSIVPSGVDTSVNAGGTIFLGAAGAMALGSASQTANLDIVAGAGMEIQTGGSLTVSGGDNGHTFVRTSSGSLGIVAAGDVTVSGGAGPGSPALLYGDPHVNIVVGGTIHLNGNEDGGIARIQSASPSSINIVFADPGLTGGGYFVDGVEGALSSGDTGFFVGDIFSGFPGGVAAAPGAGFNVSYVGGGGSSLITPGMLSPQLAAIEEIVQAVEEDKLKQELEQAVLTGGQEEQEGELPLCR